MSYTRFSPLNITRLKITGAKAAGLIAILAAITMPTLSTAQSTEDARDVISPWVEDAKTAMAKRKAIRANKRAAKNVILFIADGMDPTTVTAARIFDGQSRGEEGEENFLAFETFPYLAMVKTYTTNAQTPDSAGTATAMVTGVKTKSGIISMTDKAQSRVCAASKGSEIATLAELAERAGLATGVVSTARLTHATPATMYAHAANRNWEADVTMSKTALAQGCRDIASQLIDFADGDGIDVAMGGGRSNFLPQTVNDPEEEDRTGRREDGRNLVEEWTSKSDNHVYVWDKEGFEAIDAASNPRVLGLFQRSHMQYEMDRSASSEINEPSLAQMTAKSIDILSRNKKGYVLMVEGGRVDHAHHAGNAARALSDAQAFSQAVARAVEMTNPKDTLIIVTADHGHTLALQGYPVKGNDILGLVKSAYEPFNNKEGFARGSDNKPYPTLTYANGPGSVVATKTKNRDGRPLLGPDDVADIDFKQPSAIPLGSETHGGQDVIVYAQGPHAWLFSGVVEQTYIFHVIDDALNLKRKANRNTR